METPISDLVDSFISNEHLQVNRLQWWNPSRLNDEHHQIIVANLMRLTVNRWMETGDYHSFIVRWYNKHETAIGHLPVTMTTIVALFHIHRINNNISSKKKKKKKKEKYNLTNGLCCVITNRIVIITGVDLLHLSRKRVEFQLCRCYTTHGLGGRWGGMGGMGGGLPFSIDQQLINWLVPHRRSHFLHWRIYQIINVAFHAIIIGESALPAAAAAPPPQSLFTSNKNQIISFSFSPSRFCYTKEHDVGNCE